MSLKKVSVGAMLTVVGRALALARPAQAGMMGSTVNVDFFYPSTADFYCTNGSAVVTGGVEYPSSCSGFGGVIIDISDTQMSVDTGGTGWAAAAFNGFRLTVLSGPAISSASYAGGTMGVTSLTVDSGSLWVNFAGQTGGKAFIDLGPETGVPEPGTGALLAASLLTLGAIARRRAFKM